MAKAAEEAETAEAGRRRSFHWWLISDLVDSGFVLALVDAGLTAGPDARLEFDGEMLRIVEPDEAVAQSHEGDEGHNFVHRCPPDCP